MLILLFKRPPYSPLRVIDQSSYCTCLHTQSITRTVMSTLKGFEGQFTPQRLVLGDKMDTKPGGYFFLKVA